MIDAHRRTLRAIALATGACVGPAAASALDVLPEPPVGPLTVELEVVATGLLEPLDPINNTGPSGVSFPTDAAPLPDGSGRVLVMALKGSILLLDGAGGVSLFHDFVDPAVTEIRPLNFGPTTIEPHPQFATNGRFYTVETEVENAAPADFGSGANHQDVLYEYTMVDPTQSTLAASGFSKRELLRVNQPQRDHNVNDLAFLADGTLLIAIGDGGNSSGVGENPLQLNAQRVGVVHGKTLRIDPLGGNSANGAYGVPADNPFLATAGALPELYTTGHRNPYRIHVDPATDEAWIGEVGQRTIEEVNRLTPGGNYGWPSKEGSFLFGLQAGDADGSGAITNLDVAPDPDANANGVGDFADANALSDPVLEYDRDTGRSIAGGVVYRGASAPALRGLYLFGDFGQTNPGGFFVAPATATAMAGQTGQIRRVLADPAGAPMPDAILGFATDADGEVLILSAAGEILRIVNASPCPADISADGVVDGADLGLMLGAWGSPEADLTGDGATDGADLGVILGAWGPCP